MRGEENDQYSTASIQRRHPHLSVIGGVRVISRIAVLGLARERFLVGLFGVEEAGWVVARVVVLGASALVGGGAAADGEGG